MLEGIGREVVADHQLLLETLAGDFQSHE